MRAVHLLGAAAMVATLAAGPTAGAQQQLRVPSVRPPSSAGTAAPPGLRSRFGLEVALRLLRSPEVDVRLRGLERVAGIHTPEALALLEHAAGAAAPGGFEPRVQIDGIARVDPRALLVVVRGLAAWTDREPARDALVAILGAPTPALASRFAAMHDPAADEVDGLGRVLLARRQAAMALARSGESQALDALVAGARGGGPGQMPALEALAMRPPSTGLLGGVALTTPGMIALATEVGDLRSLGAILGALHTSDPALRSSAFAALGLLGDARVLEPAREALKDKDARVRLAAADALARLGAPDAGKALEGLIADDATARDALHLAERVVGEEVTKAAAARAASSADLDLQEAAVAVLGRQTSAAAVTALVALAKDARLQGDAVQAIARSPSPAAMGAVEGLAAAPATRRLAARAYLVRRMVRGDRSARLDALLASLAGSADAGDRAVAVEALVAFGALPLEQALGDRDARVRRAAANASLTVPGHGADALRARLLVEKDGPTRQVLARVLADGDPGAAMATLALVDRAEAGGPDAPLAALALARREDDEVREKVDALLASRDPVLRAHVARGLGESRAPDASGRLAAAYLWEADARVRRALVEALAARPRDESRAPARHDALELAADLDPEGAVRATARAALAGTRAPRGVPTREVAWVRVVAAPGAVLPAHLTAALVDADGVAWPIAWDDDGYALVPGLSAGQAQVRMTSSVPAYAP